MLLSITIIGHIQIRDIKQGHVSPFLVIYFTGTPPSYKLIQQNSIFQRQTIAFNHSFIHSLLNISPHFHQAFTRSETFLLYSTPVQSSRCKCSFIATVCIRATDTTPAAIVPMVISRLQCIDYVAMTASIHPSMDPSEKPS